MLGSGDLDDGENLLYWALLVVCRLHHFNTLKQELNGTNAYKKTSTDEKTVVNSL